MTNAASHYRRLLALLPETPSDVGEVVEVTSDGVVLELLNGSRVTARGVAALGDLVYIRGGVVEGPAPSLATVEIEV